jgi:hypothetical protein
MLTYLLQDLLQLDLQCILELLVILGLPDHEHYLFCLSHIELLRKD